jgi:hypothetical protein
MLEDELHVSLMNTWVTNRKVVVKLVDNVLSLEVDGYSSHKYFNFFLPGRPH